MFVARTKDGADFLEGFKRNLRESDRSSATSRPILGQQAALVVHVVIVALGVGVLVASSPVAFNVIRYAGAARYDDTIRVETWVDAVQSRMITFRYEIVHDAAAATRPLATATTKLVALDRHGATRALPAELLERFRALLADPA